MDGKEKVRLYLDKRFGRKKEMEKEKLEDPIVDKHLDPLPFPFPFTFPVPSPNP